MSLPSRGAWIEINVRGVRHQKRQVAPLAGSVDRNLRCVLDFDSAPRSLPSRGAWIEIVLPIALPIALPSLPSRGAWIEIKRQAPL